MLPNISLGRFLNNNSVIHKIDPRIKLLFNFIFILLTFFTKSYLAFAFLFAVAFMIIRLTKIPLKLYLKNLRSILFFILITFMINIFFVEGAEIFRIGILKISAEGLNVSFIAALRLILLLLTSSVLLFVTPMSELTLALEKILTPLKFFRVNVRDIATIITISLRFVPILLEEADKIVMAQKARGADINSGNILKRAKSLSNILIPLFVSAFRRAEDLSLAMESRCYDYDCVKTKMKSLNIKTIDIMSVFVIIIISIIVVWCNLNIY